jgi:hypothetical protein
MSISAAVTDGPFAETKEAIGGFDLLECDSLEQAVEIAATHPSAQGGTIEVRPGEAERHRGRNPPYWTNSVRENDREEARWATSSRASTA